MWDTIGTAILRYEDSKYNKVAIMWKCHNFMKCSCNWKIKSQLLVTKSHEIQSHILICKGAAVWNNVTISRKLMLQLQCIVTMRTTKLQETQLQLQETKVKLPKAFMYNAL